MRDRPPLPPVGPSSAGGPPMDDLSERARRVFRDLVETYLDSGQPVGSRTLARAGGLDLSPASIRNVMQDLEELGLLAAPHTSAGRMPTERGLRLFVDGMLQMRPPSADEAAALEAAGDRARPGGVSEAVERTTAVLAGLSSCAALVAAPPAEPRIRRLHLVPLSDGRALVIIEGPDGALENRLLELPTGVDRERLEEVANHVNARLGGLSFREASERLAREIEGDRAEVDRLTADLVAQGLARWSTDGEAPILIVRGSQHLVDDADLERVRLLLEELESKARVASLLDEARRAASLKVFIGAETHLFALSGSSVVAAPYRGADGQIVGVVGVIGPTRLNYGRVVPMVDFTAARLTRLHR